MMRKSTLPKRTYNLGHDHQRGRYIQCLVCTMKSYNIHDIEQRYCGFCHEFHDHLLLKDYISLIQKPDMATISITKLYQLLSDLTNPDTAETVTSYIEEKIKEEVDNKSQNFLTKDDKADLLKEINTLKNSMDTNFRWYIVFFIVILGALIILITKSLPISH